MNDFGNTPFGQSFEQNGFAQENFAVGIKRLMIATGATSETELSRVLGIKQPSIASARRRRQLPPGWIADIAKNYDVSADWLFFGKGPMKRKENFGPTYPIREEPDLIKIIGRVIWWCHEA